VSKSFELTDEILLASWEALALSEVAEEVHKVAAPRVDAAGRDEGVDVHGSVVAVEELPGAATDVDLPDGGPDRVDTAQATEPAPSSACVCMYEHGVETYQTMSS
jgi:hypothetical protein